MVDRIVRMGLGVFVGVLIARYLGPSGFGSLSFSMSFVALFTTAATLGLDSIAARNIVRAEAEAPRILGTAFAMRMAAAVAVSLLANIVVQLIQPDDRVARLLVGVLSLGFVFQAFDIIDAYFQANVRSKLTVWAKNAAFLAAAVIRILLIYFRAPLWSFAAAQVTELAFGALGMALAYAYNGGRIKQWQFEAQRAVELLKQSWPVMLTGMSIMIYMRIDVVMLKLMQGDHAVGIYGTATRLSEAWYFVAVAIVSSVSPAIIKAKGDPALYYGRIAKLFSLLTLIGIFLGAAVALSSHWIIRVLYSDEFIAAAPVLAVHIWASVFVFLGLAQDPWSVSENLQKLAFYRTLAGAIINIALNFWLIPRYSALGAAVATVVSYAIAGVFANAFDARTRPIFALQLKSFYFNKLWAPL
jgi:polysaccharide transporter, PST family